jgi:hypothetical protein
MKRCVPLGPRAIATGAVALALAVCGAAGDQTAPTSPATDRVVETGADRELACLDYRPYDELVGHGTATRQVIQMRNIQRRSTLHC